MHGDDILYYFHGMATLFFLYNIFLLLRIKNRTRLQKILSVIFIFWFLTTILDFIFYTKLVRNEYIRTIVLMIDTLAAPACSFFVLELVSPKWLTFKRAIYILLPFIFMILIYVFHPTPNFYELFLDLTVLFSIVIVVLVGFATTRYNKYILKNYSYNENIDIKWIFPISVLFFITMILWAITSYNINWLGDSIYYISSIILWTIIIFKTTNHINIFLPNNLEVNSLLKVTIDEPIQEPIILFEDSIHFDRLLKQAFEQKQLYLNPKLTINDVAHEIGTNRTYLSSYLNNELKITFYDFINSMRIEMKAKQLLKEKARNLTIEEIAQESGFNSVSTFHRAFLKHTGKTPNDFRRTNDGF